MRIRYKILSYSLIAMLIFSGGYLIAVYSNGGTPTIDTTGLSNFPWFNATSGINAPEFYLNGDNKTDYLSQSEHIGATAYVGLNESLAFMENYFVCDGVDDDVELQAAIDYVNGLERGKVHIERGFYSISNPIDIYGSIWISGTGIAGTVLQLANNADCNILQYLGVVNQFWFTLSDIKLHGNRANNLVAGTGLHIAPGAGTFSDWRIRDVAFMYFRDFGIYSTQGWQAYIHGCIVEHCTDAGMKLLQGSIYIDETSFLYNRVGLWLTSGEFFGVHHCKFHRQTEHGMKLETACDYSIISDSWFFGNGQTVANTYYGLVIDQYANYNIITGNTFDGSNQEKTGISVQSGSDGNTIIANNFLDHVNAPIEDYGTDTGIFHNSGIITENEGADTLSNGTTSIVVSHGCDYTPSAGDISVHPIEPLGSASYWYVDTITSTQFTIRVDANPGQDVDFAWNVDRH